MKKRKKRNKRRGINLIIPIILFFSIMGAAVYVAADKISTQMSASAVENLSENLDLIRGTIEVMIKKEAEFQKLLAQEIATMEDPEEFIRSYNRNNTMVKISFVSSGKTEGISNTGETFSPENLDFSSGKSVEGLMMSQSYLNSMGTWAYTIKCPVKKDNKVIATLYVEYIYDSLEDALPDKFYNKSAILYIMDVKSQRLVLKPKGMGERAAGHINLSDFYRANKIYEEKIKSKVSDHIEKGKNIMFYHDIQDKESLIYMWSVNGGVTYLIGYVPVQAIQREGTAVNHNIYFVVVVMLLTFFICCGLFFFSQRQQNKIRKEREREREVHNKQLAEALQVAQIANNSKTTFLSNMSHDIRTPMNAILGFTSLLAKEADNVVKVKEYTKKITASGQHLLSLINDVLDVSKIESGKVVLTIGEFTLSSMISSVDAIIRPAAEARGQIFEVTVTGVKHEYLIGDETRINQILINLLSNAVKYTQEGGNIWLRIIGLEQRSSQYEHIRIEVEDNGYGMTPEYLEVIFDAFTRAENSTTNKVQGTGLGMAITKNIVKLMGGTIEVASEVDKGSCFTVDLELRIPEEVVDEQFWKEHGVSRMFVIDDEEDILDNVQMLMEDTPVSVDVSCSSEEGIRQICDACEQGNPYHMILLDWNMPEMNGIETARQIREKLSEHIPILLLTSYDWDELEEEAEQAGVDGFLSKPFFVSAFKEKVRELQFGVSGEGQKEEEAQDYSLEGRNFLVAEDNEINSEILSEVLNGEGASCEIAENGELALERFSRAEMDEFDAILMDVQMPVMNGYEATRAIRALEREDAKTIPIIAMTANAFAEDVKDALAAGMNAHIAKPIDMESIKKTLGKYLK